MRRRACCGWCLLLLALGGCSSDGKVRDFLGKAQLSLLASSDVQAYRIDPMSPRVDESLGAPANYAVTQEGPALSAEQRERFLELVLDGGNWNFNVSKDCEFSPGVALRYRDDGREMVVLLCYSCDEWGFYYEGKTLVEDSSFLCDGVPPSQTSTERQVLSESDSYVTVTI